MGDVDEERLNVLHSLKQEFPTLSFQIKEKAVCVYMLRFWPSIAERDDDTGRWTVNEDVRQIAANYVLFRELKEKILRERPDLRGAYLVVNSPTDRFIYETFDPAWREKAKHGVVERIADDEEEQEVLALGNVQKPAGFDDMSSREIPGNLFTTHNGFHVNRSRRWLCVSLQMKEGRGFRKEFFLLDTGSPKSIMIRDLAEDLHKGEGINNETQAVVEVEGVQVQFELQPRDEGDARTQNINLLGTDFLNHFVLIDDFGSKTITVLKRATPSRIIY